MRLRLPPLVRHQRFKVVYLALWGPYILLYQLINRWPLREPVELPFTALDRAIPFVPELLPIYVAYIPLYWWVISRLENDREVSRAFYATHLQLALALPVFAWFPVRMPRELFYGPELYGWADAFWRWFDAPNNCLPSLHAANCMLLMQLCWSRSHRALHVAALAAVIASTVLVKQHYAVDLLAGGLLYAISAAFLARLEITGVDATGWALARGS